MSTDSKELLDILEGIEDALSAVQPAPTPPLHLVRMPPTVPGFEQVLRRHADARPSFQGVTYGRGPTSRVLAAFRWSNDK